MQNQKQTQRQIQRQAQITNQRRSQNRMTIQMAIEWNIDMINEGLSTNEIKRNMTMTINGKLKLTLNEQRILYFKGNYKGHEKANS